MSPLRFMCVKWRSFSASVVSLILFGWGKLFGFGRDVMIIDFIEVPDLRAIGEM